MRIGFFLLVLICPSPFTKAQHHERDGLLIEAQRLLDAGQIPEAVERLDRRAIQLLSDGDLVGYITGYTDISDIYVQLGDYPSALGWLDRVRLDTSMVLPSELHVPLIEWQLYRGFVLEKMGDYLAAKDAYEKVRLEWMRPEDEIPLQLGRYLYQPLGNINARLGEYEQALLLLETFKRLARQSGDYDAIAQASNDISIVYKTMGNLDRAISLYLEALFFPEMSDRTRGILHSNLAAAFLDSGNVAMSLQHALQAVDYLSSDSGNPEIIAYRAWTNGIISNIYMQQQQFSKALDAADRALKLAGSAYTSKNRREVGKLFTIKGEILLRRKEPVAALQNFQKALSHVVSGFNPDSPDELPPRSQLFAENTIVEALDGKAKAYYAIYRADTSDHNKLDNALDCYAHVFHVEDLLAKQYDYQASKLRLLDERYQRSSAAMDVCFEAYQWNHEEAYLTFAFNLMERNKSTILLESVGFIKAQRQAAVPAADIERELKHKRAIAYYKTFLQEYDGRNPALDSVWHDRLLREEAAWLAFQNQLRLRYPHYVKLAEAETKVVSPKAVQENVLKPDQSMVEYFFTDRFVYAMLIGNNKIVFQRINATAREVDNVRTYLNEIRRPSYPDDHSDMSHILYKTFLSPLFPDDKIPPRLIIVPDAILMYLPFETLAVNDGQSPDLLLHHSAISYSFSASVLHTTYNNNASTSDRLLAMAPGFAQSQTLAALPYSTKEVTSLDRIVPAALKLGVSATKRFFLQHQGHYKVIHLSTHAAVDAKNSLNSWIGFYEPDGMPEDSSKLYLWEIYNLSLPAQLVVLSACETGTGYLSQGEGVMSLARGFAFAGCPSTVTTLWQVNDEATSQLTTSFYTYLAKGWDKDKALRQAKLDYIARDDMDAAGRHPFFWSSFIVMGNTDAIKFEQPRHAKLIIATLVLLAIACFILIAKRARKAKLS